MLAETKDRESRVWRSELFNVGMSIPCSCLLLGVTSLEVGKSWKYVGLGVTGNSWRFFLDNGPCLVRVIMILQSKPQREG